MVARPPAGPSQPHSPPGRLSGWAMLSRFTNVTVAPGSTRSTVGVTHRSVRATVVPRPSVAGAWQPPPASAGATASTVAARTASIGTSTRSRRRRMSWLLGWDADALVHPAAGSGSRSAPGTVVTGGCGLRARPPGLWTAPSPHVPGWLPSRPGAKACRGGGDARPYPERLVLGLGPGAAGGHGDLQRHPQL